MNELHWEAVPETGRVVLELLGQTEVVEQFYLAGGTGLALLLGHRISADLFSWEPGSKSNLSDSSSKPGLK